MASKTTAEMRNAIRHAYPGTRWSERVDSMTDGQVYAVYMRLLKDGRITVNC